MYFDDFLGGGGGNVSSPFHVKRLGIDRQTIDFTSSVTDFLLKSRVAHLPRNPRTLRNFPQWTRQVKPLVADPPGEYDGVCNFLACSATSKCRSPCIIVKWFPDSRKLLTGTHMGELAVWNSTHFGFEDMKRLPIGGGAVTSLEWSALGDRLYAGDASGQVVILSSALNPLDNRVFQGLSHPVLDLSLSPTGTKLVACATACHPVIWDVELIEIERTLTALHFDTNSTSCIKWHPEKSLIASGCSTNWLYLWDPRTAKPVGSTQAHKNSLTKISWQPGSGRKLLTCGKDTLVKLWDLRKLVPLHVHHTHTPDFLAENLDYISMSSNPCTTSHKMSEPTCCSWNPVRPHIYAVGDSHGGLTFWSEFKADEPLCQITRAHGGLTPAGAEKESSMLSMDWHPMGHLIATSSDDRYIRYWSQSTPGTVSGKVVDAHRLCEIEQTGSFPLSRFLPRGVASSSLKSSLSLHQASSSVTGGKAVASGFSLTEDTASMEKRGESAQTSNFPSSSIVPGSIPPPPPLFEQGSNSAAGAAATDWLMNLPQKLGKEAAFS